MTASDGNARRERDRRRNPRAMSGHEGPDGSVGTPSMGHVVWIAKLLVAARAWLCALRGAGAGRALVFCVMSILAAWDEDTAETWLKWAPVIDAREIRCPVKVAEGLLQSFKDGGWDESDVPPDSSPLSKRDEVVWLDVLDDAATHQQETISKADRTRFVRWLAAREQEVEDAPTYRPSAECQSDMVAQGANAYTDLLSPGFSTRRATWAAQKVRATSWARSMECPPVS
eukprot:593815-Prymnesium_polylepis.1